MNFNERERHQEAVTRRIHDSLSEWMREYQDNIDISIQLFITPLLQIQDNLTTEGFNPRLIREIVYMKKRNSPPLAESIARAAGISVASITHFGFSLPGREGILKDVSKVDKYSEKLKGIPSDTKDEEIESFIQLGDAELHYAMILSWQGQDNKDFIAIHTRSTLKDDRVTSRPPLPEIISVESSGDFSEIFVFDGYPVPYEEYKYTWPKKDLLSQEKIRLSVNTAYSRAIMAAELRVTAARKEQVESDKSEIDESKSDSNKGRNKSLPDPDPWIGVSHIRPSFQQVFGFNPIGNISDPP